MGMFYPSGNVLYSYGKSPFSMCILNRTLIAEYLRLVMLMPYMGSDLLMIETNPVSNASIHGFCLVPAWRVLKGMALLQGEDSQGF